jgi:mannose/fructose/N-acetylgalactosamine-specific phosphotransferase system component IIB
MESQLYLRIDNRLVHGQVVQYWIGHLEITHLIVADDAIARNSSMSIIYRMALPETVGLSIIPVRQLSAELEKAKSYATMVLVKDVEDLTQSIMYGAEFKQVTIGNVHSSSERHRVTEAVYLSEEEVRELAQLCAKGIKIEIQTFPGEIMRFLVDDKGVGYWKRP